MTARVAEAAIAFGEKLAPVVTFATGAIVKLMDIINHVKTKKGYKARVSLDI